MSAANYLKDHETIFKSHSAVAHISRIFYG